MPRPAKRQRTTAWSMFVDDQAAEGSEESDKDTYEDSAESHEEYIVRQADVDRGDDLAMHAPRYLVQPQDEAADQARAADAIVTAIVNRHASKGDDGAMVWKAAVVKGREVDVANTIQTWCQSANPPMDILSAWTVKNWRGFVLVAAHNLQALARVQKRVAFMRSFPPAVPFSVQEASDLTGIPVVPPDLNNSWVRYTRRGPYCGDLAWVRSVNHDQSTVCLWLLPRLQNQHQGPASGRPARGLFLRKDLIPSGADPSVTQLVERFDHDGDSFCCGFLVLSNVPTRHICEEDVAVTLKEFESFRDSPPYMLMIQYVQEQEQQLFRIADIVDKLHKQILHLNGVVLTNDSHQRDSEWLLARVAAGARRMEVELHRQQRTAAWGREMAASEEKQSQRRFLRNQLHKKRKAQRDDWENSQREISGEDVSLEAAAAYAALLVVQDQQLVKSGKSWLVTPEDEYQLQLDGEDEEGKARREQELNLDFQESAEADAEFWSTMSSMGSRSGLHNYQSSLSPELTKLLEAAKRQLFEQLVPFFEVRQALFRALQPFDGPAEANDAALYLLGQQLKHIFPNPPPLLSVAAGEEARVISGPRTGQVGLVTSLHLSNNLSLTVDGSEFLLPVAGVVRNFQLGDRVRVMEGQHAMQTGHVVYIDWDEATALVFRRLSVLLQVNRLPSVAPEELVGPFDNTMKTFSVKLTQLEWCLDTSLPRPAPDELDASGVPKDLSVQDSRIQTDEQLEALKHYENPPCYNESYFHEKPRNTERDIYRHMEVEIIRGPFRGYFGIVRATRQGGAIVDVFVEGRLENNIVSLRTEQVQERFTLTPLAVARCMSKVTAKRFSRLHEKRRQKEWRKMQQVVLNESCVPSVPPADSRPPPEATVSKGAMDDTWTANSKGELLVCPDLEGFWDEAQEPTFRPPVLKPGEWLYDQRIWNQRLDVRIEGTVPDNYRQGEYEGRTGFVNIKGIPKRKNPAIQVVVGRHHKFIPIQIQYLSPMTTMEREGSNSCAPVLQTIGSWVVITGRDTDASERFIGQRGQVIGSKGEYGFVRLKEDVASFATDSICRSNPGDIY